MKRNTSETKARILAEATQHFAKFGFAGARVDDIAAASSINKRMLYHYFEDKQGLYERALAAQMKQMHEAISSAEPVPREPDDIIRHVIGVYYDYCHDHPDYIALMLWEMVSGWETLNRIADEIADPVHDALAGIIETGIIRGQFHAETNPRLFVAMAIVQIFGFFPMLKHPHLVNAGRAVTPSADETQQYKQQMIDYFMRALAHKPSPGPTDELEEK